VERTSAAPAKTNAARMTSAEDALVKSTQLVRARHRERREDEQDDEDVVDRECLLIR
jgi:hypothetical protein